MRKGSGKKYITIAVIIAGLFLVLMFCLLGAESRVPHSNIRTIGDAFWYSLTTLTTVGYGDTYPVTHAGRFLGAILQILSTGVFLLLITAVFSTLRSRFLPSWRLSAKRSKTWFIFSEYNDTTEILSEAVLSEIPDSLIIFSYSGSRPSEYKKNVVYAKMTVNELLDCKKASGTSHVFFMSEDFRINETEARKIDSENAVIYIMSDHEPHDLPFNVKYFNPYDCAARLYWQKYPVARPSEKIVIIGSGKYASALLESALIFNIFNTMQKVSYRIYGDTKRFQDNHPHLIEYLKSDKKDFCDTVEFIETEWKSDEKIISEADRIIICEDDINTNNDILSDLRRYFPTGASVYARTEYASEQATAFGSGKDIYFPETVMRMKLNEAAVKLHEGYIKASGASLPAWNSLGNFLRRSNLASADHLKVKTRILLGSEAGNSITPEICRKAYGKYKSADEFQLDIYRRIEHERWMRFHLANNWQYSAVRDNEKRLHPLLTAYDNLSEEDKRKDEYAWELLGTLAADS